MAVPVRGSLMLMLLLVLISVSAGGRWVVAQVHHVVGDDRGWDSSSDIGAWSSGRIFRVGDNLWFAYSIAQESIVELRSKEELESCDVSNPIRMYTNGLDSVSLDVEGTRYFTSGRPENCKQGLKLNVEVLPQQNTENQQQPMIISTVVEATGPTPSAAASIYLPRGAPSALWVGFVLPFFFLGLYN
ncbi:PREDICTED: mavicyanin-like [Nelumbo nucifera]|uniref:Mavicyanin-like n=1 Tax=Nelumbo nucifera TaxID=4432 RepID=A0A1U8AQY5_NELNU|nr:PREDICTED: mavicyanin-like [Nelumbo nucifera]